MYPGGATDPTANHYAADRATLRRLLSSGLDDVLHTGAEFVDYEVMPDGRVRADFADGRTASGDLLVGADGANSRVRRHLLPELVTIDTGAVGIAHKNWLTEDVRTALPSRLLTGMNLIDPDAPFFLLTSVFEPPAGAGRPYLLCALVARQTRFPQTSPRSTATASEWPWTSWSPVGIRGYAGRSLTPIQRRAARYPSEPASRHRHGYPARSLCWATRST